MLILSRLASHSNLMPWAPMVNSGATTLAPTTRPMHATGRKGASAASNAGMSLPWSAYIHPNPAAVTSVLVARRSLRSTLPAAAGGPLVAAVNIAAARIINETTLTFRQAIMVDILMGDNGQIMNGWPTGASGDDPKIGGSSNFFSCLGGSLSGRSVILVT